MPQLEFVESTDSRGGQTNAHQVLLQGTSLSIYRSNSLNPEIGVKIQRISVHAYVCQTSQ